MNPLTVLHDYQIFKANNKYNYPLLFLLINFVKTMGQLTLVVAVTWGVYSASNNHLKAKQNAPASNTRTAADDYYKGQVEIPAAAPKTLAATLQNTTVKAVTTIRDWEWVFKQDADKYTIQYGSSPDKELLLESAGNFTNSDAVTVFPFKRTPTKRIVYGYSAGLYDDLDSAKQAVATLPENVQAYGPWIRSIDELQKQIAVTLSN